MTASEGRPSLWQRRNTASKVPKVDTAAVAADVAKSLIKSDLSNISDDYEVLELLGQGSVGVVHRAVQRKNGEQVALKVVRSEADEEEMSIAKAEFLLLQRVCHPNIVRAIDFFSAPGRAVLVLAFFAGHPLSAAVQPKHNLTKEETARLLFVQLLQALDCLHQNRIVHRDVKPANVLVDGDYNQLKLIDFNISRYLPEGGALSPRCTREYAAPEVIHGRSPGEASDIWGAGLCLCMMLFGHCPNASRADNSTMLDGLELSSVSEQCKATLRQCLVAEHSMRPAATTLLQMEWMPPEAALWDSPLRPAIETQRFSSGYTLGCGPFRPTRRVLTPDTRKMHLAKIVEKRRLAKPGLTGRALLEASLNNTRRWKPPDSPCSPTVWSSEDSGSLSC